MLETIKQIKDKGLQSVVDTYSLKVSKVDDLVMLNYDMIKSPMGERVSQECRGLILDSSNHWQIVSCPFFKFFNFGEGNAAKIDWNTAKVYEKLDGSLMTLYYYKGEWRVASSGNPSAAGQINGWDTTFSELFWKTWKEKNYGLPRNTGICYMFELCSPLNRIVVRYPDTRLVLIGSRVIETLEEKSVKETEPWINWEVVKTYDFTGYTPDHIQSIANDQDPMNNEGFVVCDKNFNRVKIKGKQYVQVHHLRVNGSPTPKNILELIMSGEHTEYISYFPEFEEKIKMMQCAIDELIMKTNFVYVSLTHTQLPNGKLIPNNMSQKEFALEAVKHPFSGVLFNMRKNNTYAKEEINKLSIDSLLSLLEKSLIRCNQ